MSGIWSVTFGKAINKGRLEEKEQNKAKNPDERPTRRLRRRKMKGRGRRAGERVEGISDNSPFIISVLFRRTELHWQDERQFHSLCLLTHQVLNYIQEARE